MNKVDIFSIIYILSLLLVVVAWILYEERKFRRARSEALPLYNRSNSEKATQPAVNPPTRPSPIFSFGRSSVPPTGPSTGTRIKAPPTGVRVENGEHRYQISLESLTTLKRKALGLGSATSLLLHIKLADLSLGSNAEVRGFCVHLDHPSVPKTHTFWACVRNGQPPSRTYCGTQADRFTYQLSRMLWAYINVKPTASPDDLHNFLVLSLGKVASYCMVCGSDTGQHVLRPTTCKKACSIHLRQSALEVRLTDVILDVDVIDLLLNAIFISGAAKSTKLLAGLPQSDPAEMMRLINTIPNLQALDPASRINRIQSLGRDTQAMIAYAASSYRGFLMSATKEQQLSLGKGVHQFVLANASRELEAAYESHWKNITYSPWIVFHGTTISRLYSILSSGLLVFSSTEFQRNGHSSGSGIYSSSNTSTAVGYAGAYSGAGAISGWQNSKFHNVRVLLGCEMAQKEKWDRGGQIFVTTDPTCLMVRYVFILEPNATVPATAKIHRQMMKHIKALRAAKAQTTK